MIDYLTFIEELYKIKMQEESVDNVLTKYDIDCWTWKRARSSTIILGLTITSKYDRI